eukprot:scaffold67930_cov56-Cyclotella_meneghiniana.AAC.1
MRDGRVSKAPTFLFDGSYLTSLPSIWAKQQYGIVCSTQLANHIHTSFNNLIYDPKGHHDGEGDVDMDDSDDPEELTGNGLMLIFLMKHLLQQQPRTLADPAVYGASNSQFTEREIPYSAVDKSSLYPAHLTYLPKSMVVVGHEARDAVVLIRSATTRSYWEKFGIHSADEMGNVSVYYLKR